MLLNILIENKSSLIRQNKYNLENKIDNYIYNK